MTSGPMPSPPMIPTRWATSAPASSFDTKKPPTLSWTVESERRGGVRLRNNDDCGKTGTHAVTRIARNHTHVKHERDASSIRTGCGVPCPPHGRVAPLAPGVRAPAGRAGRAHDDATAATSRSWIERAREHGDLKENADYHAAKDEHGLNEARIRQLEAMLKNAVVIESSGAATSSSRARSSSCATTATPMSRRTSSARSKNATRSTTCCRRTHRSAKPCSARSPARP